MYGFDFLLDCNCKPWLLEINASPSLTTTTKVDKELKHALLRDVYQIVVPPDWNEDSGKSGTNICQATKIGDFTVLYDESLEKKLAA